MRAADRSVGRAPSRSTATVPRGNNLVAPSGGLGDDHGSAYLETRAGGRIRVCGLGSNARPMVAEMTDSRDEHVGRRTSAADCVERSRPDV